MKLAATVLFVAMFGTALILDSAKSRETKTIEVTQRDSLSTIQIYGRDSVPANASYFLALTLVDFVGGEWSRPAIMMAIREAAQILAQCGVVVQRLDITTVDAPTRYHDLDTPISRELAHTLQLSKPTVYFVSDTRQRPAFDAEAIGRTNGISRPELIDTVWITHVAPDAGIVLAHELVHVLTDSGAHADSAGNLMREATTPENTQLTGAQCARIREVGTKNALLRRH